MIRARFYKKARLQSRMFAIGRNKSRQRPTLPPGDPSSTIGAGGLNCSVRNGKRCCPSAIVTGKTNIQLKSPNRINNLMRLDASFPDRPIKAGLENSTKTRVSQSSPSRITDSPVETTLVCRKTPFGSLKVKKIDQASRPISIARLHTLLRFHLQPINLVVFEGPSGGLPHGISRFGVGLTLRCLQRLSLPNVATQRCSWRNNW